MAEEFCLCNTVAFLLVLPCMEVLSHFITPSVFKIFSFQHNVSILSML